MALRTISSRVAITQGDKVKRPMGRPRKIKPYKPTILDEPITRVTADLYKDLFFPRPYPLNDAFVERLAADLVHWAIEDDDALVLVDFLHSRKLHSMTFWEWVEKYPVLKEAKAIAKQAIGSRREKGAIKGKYNPAMIMSQQAKYDPSWKALEAWRADLRAKAQASLAKTDSDTRYTIVLDSYKGTGAKDVKAQPLTKEKDGRESNDTCVSDTCGNKADGNKADGNSDKDT